MALSEDQIEGPAQPMEPIVAQFDRNGTGETLTCNASFIETYDDGERFVIQFCDVMAFDNGDGDPITGVLISLAPEHLPEWRKALRSPVTVEMDQGRAERLIEYVAADLGLEEATCNHDDAAYHDARARFVAAFDALEAADWQLLGEGPS